ncbi:glycosyl transferase 2 family protein [Collimonas arenae]|uniref:Glycosyl transferase 2 family protein n=1 Tax=Collimonas arenae TaxID=279058 RepID=A0A127PL31_9BURK|nr:glycosyltransferase family 2 protein [Collimonas arenae]AMO98509.1 glycosyl transferase 2 family protein [Collimonas arenae]AMP08393.1 glycosyl transferase 2 family protein [Collimonas arenae]
MTTKKRIVSIVAPFYNESDGIDHFHQAIREIINAIPEFDFEIICVDDGSSDDTLKKLVALVARDSCFRAVELSRNFGKEAALTAGIDSAIGHAVIPIDADLQDPPELIHLLIAEWEKGAEIVLARRVDRSSDTFLKRKTAELFYRIHNRLTHIKIPENVGDFRLMDRVAVDVLKALPERQRFMKGLFAWVGFKTAVVDYTRNPRTVGNTKFSGWKLWNFALEGITSFSTAPLKLMTYVGAGGTAITLCYALYIVFRTLIHGIDVPGYASLLVAILFFGSLQLLGIGILGEYIGRIYMESKQRPIYVIRKHHGHAEDVAGETSLDAQAYG